ncbi:universal stress protein [Roseivirga sp. BDSF3-8]|uniref:universal stress protein n=1 Tax=Roseivirga sp. BDSF3-8 TaxID=3241598 RepID=UPI0035320BAE
MKKIIVPTDFSDQASFALDLAAQIARQSDAEITLLNVIEQPGSSFNTMGQVSTTDSDNVYVLEMLKAMKQKMEETASDEAYADLNLKTVVHVGHTFHTISAEIAERGADLIIMGSKGASGIEEVLIGSNTEKVVRHSKAPVITVKSPAKFDTIKNIVFATDLTGKHPHVTEEIVKLQKMLGATLHIVKVNTPTNFQSDRDIKKMMKEFVDEGKLTDYTLNIYNDAVEEDGIIYFADDINADLIALGTHGRTGLMHLLSGSVAEDVVNHSKRPVWTCKMH